jgi:hypothetical protein
MKRFLTVLIVVATAVLELLKEEDNNKSQS